MTCEDKHPAPQRWWRAARVLRPGTGLRAVVLAALANAAALAGCRCAPLAGEVEGQRFTRCAQAAAPPERTIKAGSLQLTVRERVLEISAPDTLRVAAFTGPVGARFERADLAQLERAQPELVFYLGGLGDDEQVAQANLASVGALRVPTLFIAGGADRWPVVEAAFDALASPARDYVLSASGLRELRVGGSRFVIVAGAPFGRYALDEHGCGFSAEDLDAIAAVGPRTGRTWLLSWHAPAGAGVSEAFGHELGSPDLKALADKLGALGGLYAYPEVAAGYALPEPLTLVVPRLGRVGSARADGSRLPGGVARLLLTPNGLVTAP